MIYSKFDNLKDVPWAASQNSPTALNTDSDLDGIPDNLDLCPLNSETFNKFQDDDGCPDVVTETMTAYQAPDADGDGKLSHEEAKAYLAEAGVEYEEGLHWKKVVALAEQHMKGE